VPEHSVLTIAGCRVLKASFHAQASTFRRLVEDCPNCSSTDTKPLSYDANTFPYSVYECRACADVWRFLQADLPSAEPVLKAASLPVHRCDHWWPPMPICPMCHSTSTEDLDVRPSILPNSLWRCRICCHIWKEGGAVLPAPIPPHLTNVDTARRRKNHSL
jgi:hypothetical protein